MEKVRLGDLVTEINNRIDKPSNSGYERFVGLEHYISGDVLISKWSSTEGLDSSAKLFQKNDILVARRNVYLKRASLADFAGVTSGDSIVLRAKDDSSREILPFVLNTDEFWDYADQHADGSMSKRLAPKTMLAYEFSLPTGAEKEKLCNTLWAMERTKTAYKNLITKTDELVKSQFIEMFEGKGYPVSDLVDVCTKVTDGEHGTVKRIEAGKMYLMARNITADCKLDLSQIDYVSEETHKKIYTRCNPEEGDILLVCVGATIGKLTIVPRMEEFSLARSVALIKPQNERLNSWFLLQQMKSDLFQQQIQNSIHAAAQGGLYTGNIKKLTVIVPPMELQLKFSEFVKQSDKSKFAAQQALEDLTAAQKALMRQYLG